MPTWLQIRELFLLLPRITFVLVGAILVYLPFRLLGPDLVQVQTGVSINRNALRYGRYL